MFLAMNRFKIKLGEEELFESIWRERDSLLDQVQGFKEFSLMRGDSNDEYTLFASHTLWSSKDDFSNWTKSEAFRIAHKDAGKHRDIYLGPPVFESFEKVV
tara:strand:+ start:46502 stop:46804 length:303 start_codon:yes stop_codon:yes gene_type:complete